MLGEENYRIVTRKDEQGVEHHQVVLIGDGPCDVLMALNKFTDLADEEFQQSYLIPQNFFYNVEISKNQVNPESYKYQEQTPNVVLLEGEKNIIDKILDRKRNSQKLTDVQKAQRMFTQNKFGYYDYFLNEFIEDASLRQFEYDQSKLQRDKLRESEEVLQECTALKEKQFESKVSRI